MVGPSQLHIHNFPPFHHYFIMGPIHKLPIIYHLHPLVSNLHSSIGFLKLKPNFKMILFFYLNSIRNRLYQ